MNKGTVEPYWNSGKFLQGLNQFYSGKTLPLILMQLQITNPMLSLHKGHVPHPGLRKTEKLSVWTENKNSGLVSNTPKH